MTATQSAILPEIDDYVSSLVDEPLPILSELRAHIAETSEEAIYIHPTQGRLLEILVRVAGATAILELGTHLGYSTIWLASACGPDGVVHTIESDWTRFSRARTWIERAGFSERVEQIFGAASDVFTQLQPDYYDLVFIDANKASYPEFLEESIRCTRPGGLIVADNTLHKGRVAHPPIERPTTRGIDEYNRVAHKHPALASALVPLGDGLTISIKLP